MQSVSSNAVAQAINTQKVMEKDTLIGTFTLSAGQTVSPIITQYLHEPPSGYGRLCSLYTMGQNYFQLSMNFVYNQYTGKTDGYATITNHYNNSLTTDVYVYEIFLPYNPLP